jgi:hypothetical protein
MLFEKGDHVARDVAFVESIARRRDAGRAAVACHGSLGFDHQRQRARQRRELDRLAWSVHRAIGLQPVLLVFWPRAEELEVSFDRLRRSWPEWKTVPGVLDRPGRHLLKAHRAPLLEDRQCRVKGARHDGWIEPGAGQVFTARRVPVDRGAPRRPALPHHRDHLAGTPGIHQHQRFAAEAVEILFHHTAGQKGRDAGVECVAPLGEHLECGCSREWVTGRHAAVGPHDRWPLGRPDRGADHGGGCQQGEHADTDGDRRESGGQGHALQDTLAGQGEIMCHPNTSPRAIRLSP